MPDPRFEELLGRLHAHGSDLSRWPDGAAGAREGVLRDPDLRRAYERERGLERQLAEYGRSLDEEAARAGALSRVRSSVLDRRRAGRLGDIPWRRVAAAVIVAGMVGGAVDLAVPDRSSDGLDVAVVDPLYGIDGSDAQ